MTYKNFRDNLNTVLSKYYFMLQVHYFDFFYISMETYIRVSLINDQANCGQKLLESLLGHYSLG